MDTWLAVRERTRQASPRPPDPPAPEGGGAHRLPEENQGGICGMVAGKRQTAWPAFEEPAAGLPPGWEELVDDDSGELYWHNQNTGETTWERPV